MNYLIKILSFVYQSILKPIIFLLFKLYYSFHGHVKLKQIDDPILLKPASELAQEIRSKKIKSETVVRAYIDRIKKVQPILNCVTDERFEDAIKEACEVDKLIESKAKIQGLPLLGVPFTCKELMGVKGLRFTTGLICRSNIRAEEDAYVVKSMRNAGAILLCTTNVSELGLWFESANHVYGRTRNAYNNRRMVGGSSGGEGCLISAGGSVIGLGSDVGGSIRMPAFFNGIYGHKTTNGLISNKGQSPSNLSEFQDFMLTSGPLCRYSIDLNIVLDVLLGDNVKKLKNYPKDLDFKKINFFYIEELDAPFVSKPSNEVKLACRKTIKLIEDLTKKKVKKFTSKYLNNGFFMWLTMMSEGADQEQVVKLMTDDKYKKNAYMELLKGVLQCSEHTAPTITLALMEKLPMSSDERKYYTEMVQNLRNELNELLGTNGVIIFPSFPTTAPFHNQALWTNIIDWVCYFGIYNAIGFPVTQVFTGLSSADRLPVGVQLITNKYCDYLTIKLAQTIESILGGWIQPI